MEAALGRQLRLIIHVAGCGKGSFAGRPWVSPSPTQVTTRLSDGAQKTTSPSSCGQDKGPDSEPEHANSPKPGALSPQSKPLHLELPLAPEKPMDLQSTPAAPELAPLLHTGVHTLCMKISGRPFPSMAGEPSAVIRRTAPSDASAWADDAQ
jgi:hypothetical protein